MALLRTITNPELNSLIEGDGVSLRHPHVGDFAEWADLRGRNREFLVPWEPTWPHDDLVKSAFRRRVRRYARDIREDRAYPFLLFRNIDNALVGGCTLSNVRRGVTQSCSIGYWLGQEYAHQGLMTAAVKSLVPYVFNDLHMHRLEAACLPHNDASKMLLKKVGFVEEGYAQRYLKINGCWRDHLLFAIVKDEE
jgi:ribosomal-protein-alanine N-acetyltransferase